MPIQPDPRYFDIGNAWLQGDRMRQEDDRRNALTQIEQGQFGMQQRRNAMLEDQYARGIAGEQAAGQQAQSEQAALEQLLRDNNLPPEWAKLPRNVLIDQLDAHEEKNAPEKFPAGYQEFQLAQKDPAFAAHLARQNASPGPNTPAGVLEHKYYLSLSEEGKREYRERQRGYSGPEGLRDNEFGKVTGREDAQWLQTFPKAEKSYQSAIAGYDNTIKAIDRASSQANAYTTGIMSGVKFVKGSPQFDLAENVKTVKANIGFDRLQIMRSESPTGGALGQVAVQELEALQASIASLEQSQGPQQFKQNLAVVRERYQAFRDAAVRGLETDRARAKSLSSYYGQQNLPGAGPTESSPESGDYEIGKVYKDAKGNRAKYLGNGNWEQQ